MSLFEKTVPARQGNRMAWSRKANESLENYGYFEEFLKSEDRSIEKIAEKMSLTYVFVARLAKDNEWVQRAAAYDFHHMEQNTGLSVEVIEAKSTSLQQMHENHMAIARKAQQVAVVGFMLLESYVKDYEYARQHDEEGPKRPAIKADDIVKLARFGVELERLSLGQASKITETRKQDYSQLTIEELEQLQRLVEKTEPEDE